MPVWILLIAMLPLMLSGQISQVPEPAEPAEIVLTQSVFRAETGLPPTPNYSNDAQILAWAEEYEATIGTPVVVYDLYAVMEGTEKLETWMAAFEAGEPAELLLLGTDHGLASSRYTFLLYDGGESYTCLDAHSGEVVTGTAVWENRLGWEVAGVVPLLREIPDTQIQYQTSTPCDLSVWDRLQELDPDSPCHGSSLIEANIRTGTINGLPCREYGLILDWTTTAYLETLDGSLLMRNDGMHWNQVILDQEAVLHRPHQESEPMPRCPDLTAPTT